MKTKSLIYKSIVILIGAVVIMALCIFMSSTIVAKADGVNEVSTNVVSVLQQTFGRSISNVEVLFSLDESPDYFYIEFQDGGYAIVFQSTLEIMEMADDATLGFGEGLGNKYYSGPSNYFVKENNEFVNVYTKEVLDVTPQEISIQSQLQRNTFLTNTNVRSNIDSATIENQGVAVASVPSLDDNNAIDVTNGASLIENQTYFMSLPIHNENLGDTCGSVATQILLGYFNYYSDRRIIPNNNDEHQYFFTGEYNPNTCTDPMSMDSHVLGTTNDFYYYIISEIQPWSLPDSNSAFADNGATTLQVKGGIQDILNDIDADIDAPISVNIPISYSNIYNRIINDNKPIILSLSGSLGGTASGKGGHFIVGYGTNTYHYADMGNTYNGYIAHFGWFGGEHNWNKAWVNEAWVDGYVDVSIHHIHNYDTYIGGTYQEVRCEECGHRNYAYDTLINADDTVSIIGTAYTLEGIMNIPATINGRQVIEIEEEAFYEQQELTAVTMPNGLEIIGKAAFKWCNSLSLAPIPDTVEYIGEEAFFLTKISSATIPTAITTLEYMSFSMLQSTSFNLDFEEGSTLTTLANYALSTTALTNIQLPSTVRTIGQYAFQLNGNLTSITISSSIISVGKGAFQACGSLTIFTDNYSCPSAWASDWNPSNRPVIWGCNISNDANGAYVNYINVLTNTPDDIASYVPYRKGYNFGGWYTEAEGNGTQVNSLNALDSEITKVYAKWTASSCIAEGTLITLADGSQVAVESLTGNEQLLVWNMLTGSFDSAPILFIDSDEQANYEVIRLFFSDGTEVKVIDEHAFFDVSLGEYVFLRSDASSYIGHYFNKQSTDGNDDLVYTSVQLTNVIVETMVTRAYSPVTYGHLCYYVNGMLSMPGATEGLINIFEVDVETMSYDLELMQEDIESYGLYTYEELNALIPMPEVVFNAFNGQYLKVSIGKGLITLEEIASLLNRYVDFVN